MLDRERILAKLDELDAYLSELREIAPASFEAYKGANKRACERLLQISIECTLDICKLFVTGLRLGLPAEEDDLFEKLREAKLISPEMAEKLKEMKGFRNIIVHQYGRVDDQIAFQILKHNLGDFEEFKKHVLKALKGHSARESKTTLAS